MFEENTMADEPTDSKIQSPVEKMNTGSPEPKPEEKPETIPRMQKGSEPKKLAIPPSMPEKGEKSENYKAGYRAGYADAKNGKRERF